MKAQMLAAALLLGASGYALAADPGMPMQEAPVGFNWTGGYVGGQVGYAFGASADYVFEDGNTPAYNYSHDSDGFIGGIYAGYNHQFSNNIVLGGEADIAWSDLEDSSISGGMGIYEAKTNIDWMGSARIRLGYALDRFLPYLTGGIAFGNLNFEERGISFSYLGQADVNLTGWTLGAGVEYAVTDNWILRGEYRYTKFSEKNFTTSEDVDFSVGVDMNDVRIGVAYRF